MRTRLRQFPMVCIVTFLTFILNMTVAIIWVLKYHNAPNYDRQLKMVNTYIETSIVKEYYYYFSSTDSQCCQHSSWQKTLVNINLIYKSMLLFVEVRCRLSWEEFIDTKRVIRFRKSKDRQQNGQKKRDKSY